MGKSFFFWLYFDSPHFGAFFIKKVDLQILNFDILYRVIKKKTWNRAGFDRKRQLYMSFEMSKCTNLIFLLACFDFTHFKHFLLKKCFSCYLKRIVNLR